MYAYIKDVISLRENPKNVAIVIGPCFQHHLFLQLSLIVVLSFVSIAVASCRSLFCKPYQLSSPSSLLYPLLSLVDIFYSHCTIYSSSTTCNAHSLKEASVAKARKFRRPKCAKVSTLRWSTRLQAIGKRKRKTGSYTKALANSIFRAFFDGTNIDF